MIGYHDTLRLTWLGPTVVYLFPLSLSFQSLVTQLFARPLCFWKCVQLFLWHVRDCCWFHTCQLLLFPKNNEPRTICLLRYSILYLQAPVETPNHGLNSEEQEKSLQSPAVPQEKAQSSLCENNEKTSIRPKTASPHASSPPSPSSRYSAELRQTPDQNSNSVRDLENAMSKHLPKDKTGEISFPLSSSVEASQASQASHLLKQFYSRQGLDRPGYLPDMEGDSQFLNYARLAGTAYPSSPAQPVPLKPNVYAVNPPMGHTIEGSYTGTFDQSHIYSHSTSSFHLYNRGQSWYSGNWLPGAPSNIFL